MKNSLFTLLCLMAVITFSATAQFKIPSDAGALNVKDFGAKGDGKTDDTDAILEAVNEALSRCDRDRYFKPMFIYFPTGTYLVSKTIEARLDTNDRDLGWKSGLILVGQDYRNTKIKLKDNADAFTNVNQPQAVIRTRSEARGDLPARDNGRGNEAFRHSVISLTIDVGSGNHGAIGIDYLANNLGVLEDVRIFGQNSGHVGISMTTGWPGPCLLKNVEIRGFDRGIELGHYQYGVTMEHLTLSAQREVGILNRGNVLAIRKLTSTNQVPAIQCENSTSALTLIDSKLTATGFISKTAINAKGNVLLRNVLVKGYDSALVVPEDYEGGSISGSKPQTTIAHYTSKTPMSKFGNLTESIQLPIEETPTFHSPHFGREWANVEDFREDDVKCDALPCGGGVPEGCDDTETIQRAIDSGKPIVYLPNGIYRISRPIIIRGSVKKLLGFQSALFKLNPATFEGNTMIRVDEGSSDFVVLEHLRVRGEIVHNSSKDVSLRHLEHEGYRNTSAGTGKLFVENVQGKPYRIRYGQKVWARQINPEATKNVEFDPLIRVQEGDFWALGLKTEGPFTVLEIFDGRSEILGGLIYATKVSDNDAFRVYRSDFSYFVSFNEPLRGAHKFYVRETRDNSTNSYFLEDRRHPPMFIGRGLSASLRTAEADTARQVTDRTAPPDAALAEDASPDLRIIPNPSRQQVTLLLPNNGQGETYLQVTDVHGKVVHRDVSPQKEYPLDISSFVKGVYIVTIRQAGMTHVKKLLIE